MFQVVIPDIESACISLSGRLVVNQVYYSAIPEKEDWENVEKVTSACIIIFVYISRDIVC